MSHHSCRAHVCKVAVTLLAAVFLQAGGASAQIPLSAYQDLHWRMIGPFRGGRTRAAAGVPGQPHRFYIGQVDGGIWETDDSGRTWRPIFDSQPTQSIGDLAIAPSNPDIIYVASGEGLRRPDLSVGDGIYKSIDAGKTWTHLGLRDGQAIPAVRVDPRNPDRVFAAVLGRPYGPSEARGIYRSTDGGETWQKVLSKDPNTGGCDIELDPSNPDVVYAAMWESRLGPWEDGNEFDGTGGGIFKSMDGGTTWLKLTAGLPADLVQANLAIAPSRPSRIFASVSTTEPSEYGTNKGTGLFRSDDAGATWTRITDDPRPTMRIGGGDLAVPVVDPTDADTVYACSIVAHKSTDGGKTWQSWRGAPGGDDYQNMWISPDDTGVILLVADQGAIVTENGGRTWTSWYNQPTAQLYHVIADDSFPYKVCGGQQESGSVCISSRGNDGAITFREWHPAGIIEYGYAAPDPLDTNIVYGAGRTQVSKYHWDTGQVQDVTPIPVRGQYRVDRTEPIAFSPVDPHTLYYAANVVFKTTDGGITWQTISPDLARPASGVPGSVGAMAAKRPTVGDQRGAIYSLAPSFKTVGTIWAGTDDGFVWITRDGGTHWTNITPRDLTPWSKVTQIAASRFDDDTAYVSVSRMRIDGYRPMIFRTTDGGQSWQSITQGIPDDEPVNTVREDPVRKGLLFAGTEKSVWVSFDAGDHWQSLQLDLPHTSMRDLWVKDDDLLLATHGRSFWILDDISALRQLTAATAAEPVHLFAPATATRIQRSTYTDTPYPPDEPMAGNPPDGAPIDYNLAAAASKVTIEILDQSGTVVRRYASDDPPPLTDEQLHTQLIPTYWPKPHVVPGTSADMHRFVWDLHYSPPRSAAHEYPISAVPHATPRYPLGPSAVPGHYTVRLTAGDTVRTAPLTVRMDPRVPASMADLEAQFDLASRLAAILDAGAVAISQARSVEEQLDAVSHQAIGVTAEAVKELHERVEAILEGDRSASPPVDGLSAVVGHAYAVYGMVQAADARPTAAQARAAEEAATGLPVLVGRWKTLLSDELPALNRRLQAAHLPVIDPTRPPSHGEAGGDQDEG